MFKSHSIIFCLRKVKSSKVNPWCQPKMAGFRQNNVRNPKSQDLRIPTFGNSGLTHRYAWGIVGI